MAAKKPGAPATVTLKHLAANLSESHEMSKKQTEAVLGDLVGLVTKHLKKGDRIRIGGLGILRGAQARRAHGAQSGDRRTDPDQGQQEGRLPRRQGTQGSRVAVGDGSTTDGNDGSAAQSRILLVRAVRAIPSALVGGDGLEPPTSCV